VKHLNCKVYYQELHLKYCVTWQSIDYKLPEDDTIVSKTRRIVIICKIIVHLLVTVQDIK